MKLVIPWKKTFSKKQIPKDQFNEFHDSLQRAGRILREKRESYGLSLRELAVETRISTPVLEAIEKGWEHRLPEPAYLQTMLQILEKKFELRRGSLQGAIKQDLTSKIKAKRQFTLGNINVFTTWQGSLIYLFVIAGSILLLNIQQRRISELNSQTLEPITVNLNYNESGKNSLIIQSKLEKLRPIENAFRKTSKQRILSGLKGLELQENFGVLKLILNNPKSILITEKGIEKVNLKSSLGNLSITLLKPIIIEISPPLEKGEGILWNQNRISPIKEKEGIYKLDDR